MRAGQIKKMRVDEDINDPCRTNDSFNEPSASELLHNLERPSYLVRV